MIQKRKPPVEKYVVATEQPRTRRVAFTAFAAGALLMWLATHFLGPKPPPEAQRTSGAPDVSALPPGEAAATLGNLEFNHAKWAAAAQLYERALAAGYDTPDVRTDLGTAYRHLGDAEKALAQYGIAQRKDPFHQASLFNQAVVFAEMLRDRPAAIQIAREYLRRFPQGRGADGARKIIAELEGGRIAPEKSTPEFLSAPKPEK
jgi:tetratricopeptide (TPR) repeat protein